MKSARLVCVSLCILFVTLTSASCFAQSVTNTTLTVTSGGSAVTTVPAKTVVTLTATVHAGSTAVQLLDPTR
jgi:hypothetical protein